MHLGCMPEHAIISDGEDAVQLGGFMEKSLHMAGGQVSTHSLKAVK